MANAGAAEEATRAGWRPILSETFGYGPDATSSIDLNRLEQGCPRRDCIPAIDDPEFIPAAQADFLGPKDLVLALEIDCDARAYPANILNAHEIVNDTIAGHAIVVTYCPLCGSGLAFERLLDGEPVEFGVSGLLHENDLVMYDRHTKSLWQQITGEAIVGPRTGSKLQQVPVAMTEWRAWHQEHPDSRVLVGPRGSDAAYAADHYAEYARSDRLLFPVTRESKRLGRKDVVYGFEIGARPLAVPKSALSGGKQITVDHDGVALDIRQSEDGAVTATDPSNGEQYHPVRLYWFAWYTFHPNTELAPPSGD